MMHRCRLVAAAIACLLPVSGQADDPPAATSRPGAHPPAVPVQADNWTWKGRLGGFVGNVAADNPETSRDPTINGTTSSTSWRTTLDVGQGWRSDADSIDNAFKARYGRIRVEGGDWSENNDEIRYDGVYRREVAKPTFAYLAWGAESFFTGAQPRGDVFDPTMGRAGAGVGQRYEEFLPDRTRLEWRLGARAQRGWGNSSQPEDDGLQTGAEAFLRYDHDLVDPGDPLKRKTTLRFFTQYEGFSEFNDTRHLTNLVTAGLAIQLSRYLGADFGLRAYHETRPKEDDGTGVGYGEWSLRQDTLVGLTYLW